MEVPGGIPSKCCLFKWMGQNHWNQGRIVPILPLNKWSETNEVNWNQLQLLGYISDTSEIFHYINWSFVVLRAAKSPWITSPSISVSLPQATRRSCVKHITDLRSKHVGLLCICNTWRLEDFSRQHFLSVHVVYLFLCHPTFQGMIGNGILTAKNPQEACHQSYYTCSACWWSYLWHLIFPGSLANGSFEVFLRLFQHQSQGDPYV